MIFRETPIPGAFVIEPEWHRDERGFFGRTWCQREFSEHGLNPRLVQCNLSGNRLRGTIRGLHYQATPREEAKVVSCTKGAIYDVIVDLRHTSPAFRWWFSVELTAANHWMLYIPEGLAHGFQTLEDDSEVSYLMSEFYDADSARGLRWDDPSFGIRWPLEVTAMSPRDRSFKDFA